jgi:hypothetical protein
MGPVLFSRKTRHWRKAKNAQVAAISIPQENMTISIGLALRKL